MNPEGPKSRNSTPDADAIFRDVVELLRDFVAPNEPLGMETTLFVDLSLFGDDAGAFLREYARRMNVDLSEIHFDRHFLSEGSDGCLDAIFPVVSTWRRYFRTGRKNANLLPISDRQLVEAARIGRWPAEWSRVMTTPGYAGIDKAGKDRDRWNDKGEWQRNG